MFIISVIILVFVPLDNSAVGIPESYDRSRLFSPMQWDGAVGYI